MTRPEKVAEAQRLRAEGLTYREIGERMGGYKVSTVYAWLSDPDRSLERARKASYANPCVDCGGPTDGSGGRAVTRTRCANCAARYQHETRYWTPEAIVGAIQCWADEHGGIPPVAGDWQHGSHDGYPAANTVLREFGAWNVGVEAAGFVPCPVGSYRRVSSRKYARRTTGVLAA